MNKINILIIIFGITILLLLLLVFFVNNLLLKKRRVDLQFESIIIYLKDRVELLNRIANIIENTTTNEIKLLDDIDKTSTILNEIKISTKEGLKEIKKSTKLFEKYTKLAEIYPTLNDNKIYSMLIDEIELNESRLEYAIESYDKEAKKYNELKQTKINSIVSKVFNLKDYELFK